MDGIFFNKEERSVGVVSYSTEVGIFWFYSIAFCRQHVNSVTFVGGCAPQARPSFKRTPFFLRNQGCSAEQIRLANKINETSSF